jgi:hypothetical protein
MRYRPCVFVGVLAVAIAGCAPPRVDSATDDSFSASLDRVRRFLPADQRPVFDQAVTTISAHRVTPELVASGVATTESVAAGAKAALHGKAADEILAEAARLEAEQAAQARRQVEKEIAALVAEQESAFAAREALKAFEILQARLLPSGDATRARRWQIRLVARNGTAHAVSRVFVEATVERPGRAGPWLREELTHAIPGQLGPGASGAWVLTPGSWAAVEIPQDARLGVTVTRLDGAEGEPFLDAREYTETDAARLITLQHQLTALTP